MILFEVLMRRFLELREFLVIFRELEIFICFIVLEMMVRERCMLEVCYFGLVMLIEIGSDLDVVMKSLLNNVVWKFFMKLSINLVFLLFIRFGNYCNIFLLKFL